MADAMPPEHLVAMDWLIGDEPFLIDLVYADAAHPHNIFKTALYDSTALLWLHRDLVKIVIGVARDLRERYGWTLVLHDGLRVMEAQDAMQETEIVRAHPEWMEEPRLVSPPGKGGHPRGMAIDVSIKDIDMGTVFDDMSAASARDYADFPAEILQNRARLEESFVTQAQKLSLPMLPLPNEWWDFRFPKSHSDRFLPLSDSDLPDFMRLTSAQNRSIPPEWQTRFDKTRRDVLNSLS